MTARFMIIQNRWTKMFQALSRMRVADRNVSLMT